MNKIYTILLMLLCISCERDAMNNSAVDQSTELGAEILFNVVDESIETKTTEATTGNISSMRLYCYLTSSSAFGATESYFRQYCTPNWMNQVNVAKGTDGTWSVQDATANNRFHPTSNHSFFAFSPYDPIYCEYSLEMEDKYEDGIVRLDENGYEITDQQVTGSPVVKYTLPNTATNMVDLLYISHLNVTQDEAVGDDGVLDLKFSHALSKLTFTLELTEDLGNTMEIAIHGLSLNNIWTSGKLHYRKENNIEDELDDYYGSYNNYKNIVWYLNDGNNANARSWDDSEFTAWKSINLIDDGDSYKFIGGDDTQALYVIPQPLTTTIDDIATLGVASQDMTLSSVDPTPNSPILMLAYHYRVVGTVSYSLDDIRGIIIPLSDVVGCETWEPGMAYHYTIKLADDGDAALIPWAVEAVITDWTEQEMDVTIYGGEFVLTEGKSSYTLADGETTLLIPYTTTYQFMTVAMSGSSNADITTNDGYITVIKSGSVEETLTITLSNSETGSPERIINITVE